MSFSRLLDLRAEESHVVRLFLFFHYYCLLYRYKVAFQRFKKFLRILIWFPQLSCKWKQKKKRMVKWEWEWHALCLSYFYRFIRCRGKTNWTTLITQNSYNLDEKLLQDLKSLISFRNFILNFFSKFHSSTANSTFCKLQTSEFINCEEFRLSSKCTGLNALHKM